MHFCLPVDIIINGTFYILNAIYRTNTAILYRIQILLKEIYMIYFTNTKDQNIDNIRQLSPAFSSSNTDSTLLQYHMEAPFKLEFYTFHPDDPEQYFAMTSLSPNEFIYSALTKEEIKGQLEKARLHQHGYYEFLFVLSYQVNNPH